MMGVKKWLSTREAAEMLNCSPHRVSDLAREGKLESRRVGKGERAPRQIRRSSVLARLAERLRTPWPEPAEVAENQATSPLWSAGALGTVLREHKNPARDAVSAAKLVEELRWVLAGYRLGKFTAEDAMHKVAQAIE